MIVLIAFLCRVRVVRLRRLKVRPVDLVPGSFGGSLIPPLTRWHLVLLGSLLEVSVVKTILGFTFDRLFSAHLTIGPTAW